MIYRKGPPRRARGRRPGMGDMGSVEAMVLNTSRMGPGELYRRGMAGLGGMAEMGAPGLLDNLLGPQVAKVSSQLTQVEMALKICTGAAIASFALSLYLATRRRKVDL